MFESLWSKIVFILVLLLALIIGLVLLIPFPLAIYPAIVKGMLHLYAYDDGSFPKLTYYWSKPPAISYHDFYMWNITNIEEFVFYGDMASMKDVGPYSFIESEFKGPIQFSDDQNSVYFKNNRSWVYNQETSCELCSYDDVVYQPNPTLMTIAGLMDVYYENMTHIQKKLTDIGSLFLGAYPFVKVRMRDTLLEGYTDNLVDFLNSDLYKRIEKIVNGSLFGFPIPDIKVLGYFPNYNWTNDEDFVIDTGKSNYKQIAAMKKWAGSSSLSWWGDDVANDITGSSDGLVSGSFLDSNDHIKFFQSFTCRHYQLDYDSKTSVRGIHAYLYKFNEDNFNPFVDKFKGLKYENRENQNYFPDWPNCKEKIRNDTSCSNIDCAQLDNLCSSCCNGSYLQNGKILFPPGIIQQKCFPGKNQLLPFTATLSPPHFYGAPQEVTDSMKGLHPNEDDHSMGKFYIQPTIGSTVQANFRLQLSIPMYRQYRRHKLTVLTQLRSTVIPCFWLNDRITLKDYAHDYILFNTVTLSNIIMGIGIGFVALSFLLGLLFLFVLFRRRNRQRIQLIPTGSARNEIRGKSEDW